MQKMLLHVRMLDRTHANRKATRLPRHDSNPKQLSQDDTMSAPTLHQCWEAFANDKLEKVHVLDIHRACQPAQVRNAWLIFASQQCSATKEEALRHLSMRLQFCRGKTQNTLGKRHLMKFVGTPYFARFKDRTERTREAQTSNSENLDSHSN